LLDSSIDERRHESFAIVNSSSCSTPLPQQRLGELIRKLIIITLHHISYKGGGYDRNVIIIMTTTFVHQQERPWQQCEVSTVNEYKEHCYLYRYLQKEPFLQISIVSRYDIKYIIDKNHYGTINKS
jgi:hypothetical protein